MDWEKPKGNIMAMIQQQQFMYNQKQQNQQQPQYMNHQNMMQNQFMAQQQMQQQQQPHQGNHMSFDSSSRSVNMSPNSHIQKMRNQKNNNISKQVDSIGIISCWRKLFVANEWNELSVHRNIKPSFTLFMFLLFMIGFEFEYFSIEQPVASGTISQSLVTPTSMVYKFVISTFWILIISVAEYV